MFALYIPTRYSKPRKRVQRLNYVWTSESWQVTATFSLSNPSSTLLTSLTFAYTILKNIELAFMNRPISKN